MKTFVTYIIVFFCFQINGLFAQVGSNESSPNVLSEILSSNLSTPTPTNGVLVPKIEEFPSVNPSTAQDGMMVYFTGTGTVSSGFYSWNASITNWEHVGEQFEKTKEKHGFGLRTKDGEPSHFALIELAAVNLSAPLTTDSNTHESANFLAVLNTFAKGENLAFCYHKH